MLLCKSNLYESNILTKIFSDLLGYVVYSASEGKKYAEYIIRNKPYPDYLLFELCTGGHKNMKKIKRIIGYRYNEYILEICLAIAIDWRYTGMVDYFMAHGIKRCYTEYNKNHPALSEFVKIRLKER